MPAFGGWRHVLFDLDGTLTDPRLGITACIRHALAGLGEEVPEPGELERFIGPPLRDGFRDLLRAPSEPRIDEAIRLYRERFSTVGMFENRVYDGIPECLSRVAGSGRRLYVATSKPTVFASRILEHFDLAGYFRGIYGSELDGRRSGKAELLAHLLERETIAAGDAVMVGDRRHDVEGARANSLAALAVTWGFGCEDELRAASPDALVTSPEGLAELLGG